MNTDMQKAEYEALARNYLYHQKKRFKSYSLKEYYNEPPVYHVFLTDEEAIRVKQLLIETYNMNRPNGCEEAETLEQLFEGEHRISLESLKGKNAELDELLLDHIHEDIFYLFSPLLDLNDYCYMYNMTCLEISLDSRKLDSEMVIPIPLTDDEYIYLLVQLLMSDYYTYNMLVLDNPKLAGKITNVASNIFSEDHLTIIKGPFVILFDEIANDAKIIKDEQAKI